MKHQTCLALIGTTWVRELLWQIYNDGAISDVHLGSRVFWLEAHPLLRKRQSERPKSSPDPKPVIDLLPSPRLLVSHLPYDVIPKGKEDSTTCKYIYIARNPKDVVVSLYHFLLSFDSCSGLTLDILVKLFIQGKRECYTNLIIFKFQVRGIVVSFSQTLFFCSSARAATQRAQKD